MQAGEDENQDQDVMGSGQKGGAVELQELGSCRTLGKEVANGEVAVPSKNHMKGQWVIDISMLLNGICCLGS